MIEIRQYQTADGRAPFTEWMDTLRGRQAQARIVTRIDRLQAGLRGDWKTVGAGVFELRIDSGPATECIADKTGQRWCCCCALATSDPNPKISRQHMPTGKNTKPAAASIPFRAADYLRTCADIAAYLEAMLADGDTRAVPIALRTVADAVGGMTALAEKTGLSRETLYRTLSNKGNPRLDTLAAILAAFGLRLAVQPAKRVRKAA